MEKGIEKWLARDGGIFLRKIGVKKNRTVLDFGCGAGRYTLPAAGIVGESGKVYAVDRNSGILTDLLEKAAALGLSNIETINTRGRVKIPLPEESVDLVLLYDILHASYFTPGKRGRMLAEIRRVLKKKGLVSLFPKHMESENFVPEMERNGFECLGKSAVTLLHSGSYEKNFIYAFRRGV